jgi:hypothetical protein
VGFERRHRLRRRFGRPRYSGGPAWCHGFRSEVDCSEKMEG